MPCHHPDCRGPRHKREAPRLLAKAGEPAAYPHPLSSYAFVHPFGHFVVREPLLASIQIPPETVQDETMPAHARLEDPLAGQQQLQKVEAHLRNAGDNLVVVRITEAGQQQLEWGDVLVVR